MVPIKNWKQPVLLSDGFPDFSAPSIRVIQQLLSTDTTIMLTTSHKSRFTIDAWRSIFWKRGIDAVSIELLPENVNNLSRKDEILNWVGANGIIEDFLIIDDDTSLNDLPSFLKEHLILTSSMLGLTDSHLTQITERKIQLSETSNSQQHWERRCFTRQYILPDIEQIAKSAVRG